MLSRILRIILVCSVVGLIFSSLGNQQSLAATGDEYFIYSRFDPPGIDDVVAVGGYVEYTGLPGVYGDEIQYVYFLSENTGYKVKTWVTDGDGDGTIDPRQHPDHYLSGYVGPIEPRYFEIVSSADLTGYTSGSNGSEEFYIDSSGVYLGAYPNGIHKWDHNWTYLGKVANPPPARTESMAYNPADNVWYAGSTTRTIYGLSDTDNDGSFLDETWSAIFTYPSYSGSHHDGMEYVAGYLWISDMTSDVIGKWEYDAVSDSWNEVERYTYTETGDVEGMGFGPNDHFWAGSGWGSDSYIYELGDQITQGYPVAEAGPDVPNHAPTIPITLDGSGSHHTDPSKQIVLYEWDFEGDGFWDYTGTDPKVEHTYPANYNADGSIDWDNTVRNYPATLRITDNGDPTLQDTDTCIVHITAPPWKPVADPGGPYGGATGVSIQLDGSGSYDPESKMVAPGHPWYETIAKYEWDLDYDGEFDDSTDVKPSWTWQSEGIYIVSLRVTDSQPSGPGGTVGPLDVDVKYATVLITKQPPPTTKIETHEIDSVNGTAKFTWSGSDDSTPPAQLVYKHRLLNPDSPLYDWTDWSSSTTATYPRSGNPRLPDGTYRFQVKAKDADEAVQPDSATWRFTIGGGNLAPIARASDISGQPQAMYPDTNYTITAKYFDPDGRDDLKICYLQLKHPEKRLTMMWYQEDGHTSTYAGEEGENYLTITNVTATEITNGNEGYKLTWSFQINDQWPEVENAIDFGVFASDDGDLESGWDYDDVGGSFRTASVIEQYMLEYIPVSVDGQQYYIVLLKECLDPSTLVPVDQLLVAHEPAMWKVYTDEAFEPLSDEDIAVKIGAVARADRLVQRAGSATGISSSIDIIDEIFQADKELASAEAGYAWAKLALFEALDLVNPLNIWKATSALTTALEAAAEYYTDPIRWQAAVGRAALEGAVQHFEAAMAIAEQYPGGIDDYGVAEDYLQHYYAAYFKEMFGTGLVLSRERIQQSEFENVVMWVPEYIVHMGTQLVSNISIWHKIGTTATKGARILRNGVDVITEVPQYVSALDAIANDVSQLLKDETFAVDYTEALAERSIMPLWKWGIIGVDTIDSNLCSPAELQVLDSSNRATGVVRGLVEEEIPDSSYDAGATSVTIFHASDAYRYRVVGTEEGTYGLEVTCILRMSISAFTATDILTLNGVVHQYTIDWDALARGEEGVTLQIDNDGDGTYEKTIQAGSTLDGTTTPIANQPPAIDILAPVSGESISGSHYQIQWQATDPDNQASSLLIDLFYSTNSGATWNSISSNEVNDGSYNWDISALQSGEYWLKLVAGDSGGGTSEATTGPFTISTFEGQIIVAPNPASNDGAVFFYTLPGGTSTAKLMILNVTGRLLFEIPLDGDSTRFPSAGTWDPVDQTGVPLANGPYVYILIADGKGIGQGKMVIQR